jgi:adenylate cyclase
VTSDSIERFGEWLRATPGLAHRLLADLERDGPTSPETSYLRALIALYASGNDLYINPYGPSGTVKTVAYHEVENATADDPGLFKDKVVFVGPSVDLGQNTKGGTVATAYSDISSTELLATAFCNVRDRSYLSQPLPSVWAGLALAWGYLVGISALALPLRTSLVVLTGVGALFGITAIFLFGTGLWLPMAVPACQWLVACAGAWGRQYFRQNTELKGITRVKVPSGLLKEVEGADTDIKQRGWQRLGVCMATDGQGYTRLAEAKGEYWLANFMREYQQMIDGLIRAHEGVIKDWAGDGMVALWIEQGTTASASAEREGFIGWLRNKLQGRWSTGYRQTANAHGIRQALTVALRLRDAVDGFTKRHGVHFPIRIGIHRGPLWVSFQQELQVFGDTLNTASRLEGLNKTLQTSILVSDTSGFDFSGFITRRLGRFELSGRSSSVEIYELLGEAEMAGSQHQTLCTRFSDALASYEEQHWPEARHAFSALLDDFPDDGPTKFFLKICNQRLAAEKREQDHPAMF